MIHYGHLHSRWTADHTVGPQKFHKHAALRIGGLPIIIAWAIGLLIIYQKYQLSDLYTLFWIALPTFTIGFTEDITRKISPTSRLLATFLSAGLAFHYLGGSFNKTGFEALDNLFIALPILSFIFTLIAVGGVAHSINIIDGYNGLSSVVSILILLGIAYVAFKVNDNFILGASFSMIGAIIGFLIWNYPRGLIFVGDGGAYLMGLIIAELSLLLVNRHPQVSPWFPLLLVAYPVFETLFSMYRRKFLQKRSITYPDSLHLHQMVYKRIVRWMVGSKEANHLNQRNAMTSPYLWCLTLTTILPAILFWKNTWALLAFIGIFVILYMTLYRKLVRFRTPKLMIISKRKTNLITSKIK